MFVVATIRLHQVLDDVSFVIPAGKFAAFVGGSGSGKSTVVRLLLRYYDATSGCILLDDQDVRQLDVTWLRAQFGLVSQEPELFSGTFMPLFFSTPALPVTMNTVALLVLIAGDTW